MPLRLCLFKRSGTIGHPSGLALQLYSQMSARGDGGKAMLGSGLRILSLSLRPVHDLWLP